MYLLMICDFDWGGGLEKKLILYTSPFSCQHALILGDPVAKFMMFVTFENRNKTYPKIEKTWFLLVHWKKPRRCRSKIHSFRMKTPELEYIFNIVAGLRCFHVDFEKFLRTTVS